jgi:hypothetical protein
MDSAAIWLLTVYCERPQNTVLRISKIEPRRMRRAQRKGFSFAFFAILAVGKSAESDRVQYVTTSIVRIPAKSDWSRHYDISQSRQC